MVYKIRKYGDPALRKECERVEKIDDEILQLLDDMVETMHEADGIGLAAPQVGSNKRVFVLDLGDGHIRRIINPEFIEHSEEKEENEEGCLSVPGIYKKVQRSSKVKIKYMNEKWEEVTEEAEGLLARAFQHENDHLDAVLFVDRLAPVAKRLIGKKLQKLKKDTLKDIK